MTTANRPQSGGAPVQPWTPGAAPTGVTCPACGLTNEAGARTCRNCGLPIAAADDPVRGVAPGRVELPRTRRSGFSATLGFFMVVGLLLVGGSLALTGGGGLLSGGGRFFAEATPSPTPTPAIVDTADDDSVATPVTADEANLPKAKTANMKTYTCDNGSIRDLSRGRWVLSDVDVRTRSDKDGNPYDQVFWKMDRQNPNKKVNAKKATLAKMLWTTPDEAKAKYGDSIGRVLGDRAVEIIFDGPVSISFNSEIELAELDDMGIEQIRRVQLFEKYGKVRTVIGLKGDSCGRLGSLNWGANKAKKDNAQVVLDLERFD